MTSSSSNGSSCKSVTYVRPTFADDEVLTLHGCRQLSIPLPDHCANKGFVDVLEHSSSRWRFISHHNKILSSLSLDRTAADIKESILLLKAADGSEASLSHSLHLPPMLFGLDIMRIQLGTATLQLSAVDALVCWAFQVWWAIAEGISYHALTYRTRYHPIMLLCIRASMKSCPTRSSK